MGGIAGKQLQIKYKASRGAKKAGDIVQDPRDWFKALLVDDRAATLAMLESAPGLQDQLQEQFFDLDYVFEEAEDAMTWINGKTDSDIAAAKTAIEGMIAAL